MLSRRPSVRRGGAAGAAASVARLDPGDDEEFELDSDSNGDAVVPTDDDGGSAGGAAGGAAGQRQAEQPQQKKNKSGTKGKGKARAARK